jgi:hypothetical protein
MGLIPPKPLENIDGDVSPEDGTGKDITFISDFLPFQRSALKLEHAIFHFYVDFFTMSFLYNILDYSFYRADGSLPC